MLEILYTIFIAPIELLLSFIFGAMGLVTSSKSFAIVLLSLIVSILLVPIYNLFDYWQNKDRMLEKEMHPKIEMLKKTFKGQERFAMLKTVYRQFGYHPIYGVRNSLGFLLQIPFFIAAYQYLSHAPELQNASSGMFKNLSAPDQLISIGGIHLNALPIVMTIINLWSGFIYSKHLLRKDKIQVVAIALVFLVLLYNSASGLVLYWTFNNIFSLVKNAIHNYRPATKKVAKFMERQSILPYLAGTLFMTIAFFYFPSKLVASDPSVFNAQNRQLLVFGNYYSFLVLGLISLFVLKYFFAWMTKWIDASLFVLAMFAVLTATYNVFDTGVIDHFKIANISEGLGPFTYRAIIDGLLIIGLLCIYGWVSDRFKNLILLVSIAVFSIFSLITTLSIPSIEKKPGSLIDPDNNSVFIPDYINDITTISTNHPNILVVMIDGFTNPLFGEALALESSLKDAFDGFTWYSNTLSTGSNTYLGGPAIHGGFAISPYEMNNRENLSMPISNEINKGYLPLLESLSKNKYDIDLINVQYTDCSVVTKLHQDINICTEYSSESDLNGYYLNKYLDLFPEDIEDLVKNKEGNSTYLPSIGLYYSLFYSFREYIYNDGSWIDIFDDIPFLRINYSYYAFLTSYIDLLKFQNTELGQYKYLNSSFTHEAWHFYDESCKLSNKGEHYKASNMNQLNQKQFYTTYCAVKEIQKLVEKLKENGAWDNTALIFVSDHGFKGDVRLASTFTNEYEHFSFNNYPGRPSSLLLIKDFYNNAPLKESTGLMSPADVPSIICQNLGGCAGIAEDPRLNPNPYRKLIHTDGAWHPDRHPKNRYDLNGVWEVTGDMYKKENWRKIDD